MESAVVVVAERNSRQNLGSSSTYRNHGLDFDRRVKGCHQSRIHPGGMPDKNVNIIYMEVTEELRHQF